MSGDVIRGLFAVIRELRKGPRSATEIAAATGMPWRRVYRLIGILQGVGAPIKESTGAAPARGVPPKCWTITAQGLREWLG